MIHCRNRLFCGPPAILGVWLGLFLIALFSRHVIPVDETRYLSVAWEMWSRGDLLVPHLNGEPYPHKPPLLFWLINFSWALFGVSEWAARLVTALAGLAGAWLLIPLGRQFWPGKGETHLLAVWVLFSTLLWTLWTTALMFDLLIAVCAELAWLGILIAWRGRPRMGWLLAALGIALGVLAKGPVILVYVLPAALLAPLWAREPRPASWWRWYGGVLFAVLAGAALALAWALPAAFTGGDEYREAILWGQTADRVVKSFAHRQPFWWYLPLLPLVLYPWILWGPLWSGLRRRVREGLDSGERFAVVAAGSGLLIFSLISGKQVHYLLPLFPLLALLAARTLRALPEQTHAGRWSVFLVIALPLVVGGVLAVAPFVRPASEPPPWIEEMSPLSGLALLAAVLAAFLASGRLAFGVWPGATALLTVAVVFLGFVRGLAPHYEINAVAAVVAEAQAAGRPVAFADNYNGEFNFIGRLTLPVDEVRGRKDLAEWIATHPDGVIAERAEASPGGQPGVLYWQSYRSSFLVVREASPVDAPDQTSD